MWMRHLCKVCDPRHQRHSVSKPLIRIWNHSFLTDLRCSFFPSTLLVLPRRERLARLSNPPTWIQHLHHRIRDRNKPGNVLRSCRCLGLSSPLGSSDTQCPCCPPATCAKH